MVGLVSVVAWGLLTLASALEACGGTPASHDFLTDDAAGPVSEPSTDEGDGGGSAPGPESGTGVFHSDAGADGGGGPM